MHLLPVTTVSLDEAEQAVDLDQPPGDVVVLSFADSDLSALAAAHALRRDRLPSLRLASLRRLRHPLSVDLYLDRTVARARFVLVRCLGGLDYWRYGVERLSALCRSRAIPLAVLPGDNRPDHRLAEASTVSPPLARALEAYFEAGGVDNLARLLDRIAREIGIPDAAPIGPTAAEPPRPVPAAFAWTAARGPEHPDQALARLPTAAPLAFILAYRSGLLAGDGAGWEALAGALADRGLAVLTLGISSLKDPEAVEILRRMIRARRPDVILASTAFAAREIDFVLDEADCPVLQAIPVGTTREAWAASSRGLSAADLAMQVVLPEFDGRLAGGPIAFKEEAPADPLLAFARRLQVPDPIGIAAVADKAAGWVRLRRTPRERRRLALVLSDYPSRGGRAGFAVGLDAPASACALLDLLDEAGYAAGRDFDAASLMLELTEAPPGFSVPLAAYRAWLDALPEGARSALVAAWGEPETDPALCEGAFRFRAVRAGQVLVALQPDRGRALDRKRLYHDPDAAPTHAYCAFHLGLRELEQIDALIQLGTHGTTEWLPGKAVALSTTCWPHLCIGALPVIYPFIADDPGEAAPAKRRIGAVTLGHLPPPVAMAGLHGETQALAELVEEFASAQVLDPRRADLVAREIRDRSRASGLAARCGITEEMPIDQALTALDAQLCDLREVAIRDGLHVFGEAPAGLEACATGEREGLLRALDGRFVRPGPAGSPTRGRRDVLPTGRNLSTCDPRAIPTRAATQLGQKAAAEVVRRYLQDEGDWPRRIVMDLWASPTLRSGGEDIAHALALMGVRPVWDHASTRVTGFEILPLPILDRPRVDVTIRVSGAFRDTFPDQLALLDQAARAVARLEEDDEWNALAAARRRGGPLSRVFGAPPGRYGAGVATAALDGSASSREALGEAYLAGTSHRYGPDEGAPDPSFAERVGQAEAYVHVTDVAERDILDGDAVADAAGGFAAAAALAGRSPALYSLEASNPETPKARSVGEDIDRLVRGRLTNPRWIAAQLRHGWRGAAELAQAVDALFVFAAATEFVADELLDRVFAAYVADETIHQRLRSANPAAAQAIVDRLAEARRRGLWRTRLNSVAACLDAARVSSP